MNPAVLNDITEAEWQGLVTATAKFQGWACYHTLNSRGSTAGFPDLVLLRPPELVVVELKTERGKVTGAQQQWLDQFAACGVEATFGVPGHWDEVEKRLRRSQAPIPTGQTAGRA